MVSIVSYSRPSLTIIVITNLRMELFRALKPILFTDTWLPVIRSPGQRYIFWELESPAYLLGFPPQAYSNYFNWTATFRLDSTVPLPYGRVTKVTQDSGQHQ